MTSFLSENSTSCKCLLLLLLVHTSDFLLVLLVESLLALLHLALVDLTQLVQRFLHSVLVFPFCKKTWIKAAVPREVRQLYVKLKT